MKFKGFDEFEKKLNRIAKNAQELDSDNTVSFVDLFPESFMSKNTKYTSMQEFMDDFDSDITNEEFKEIQNSNEWNEFVKSNSNFADWDSMIGTATEEYAANQLFDGI
ncbi:hypothetical protein ACFOLA_02195 [Salinicoccus hispanicus]|uniref:Uncharacterized protein n=1 Tax=Salinicoccus hispanicus TaxID=157225 RepID=A0A6N8U202_9STAP|nr:hypothetical protein [Salinicoccus hispanicus]MXQ50395.1 hypothetical protein [Salinicoccus hispanicus]